MHLWIMFLFEISYYFQTFEYQYMSNFNVFEKNRFKKCTIEWLAKVFEYYKRITHIGYFFFFVKVKLFF